VEDVDYDMNTIATRAAVIGGGYAGMAAAVTLAGYGVPCHVFESGKALGGRARRVVYHDTKLDNGQHILLGAYRELLRLAEQVGTAPDSFARLPLTLNLHRVFRLHTLRLPAPIHLAVALLSAHGLQWRDRWAAIRMARGLQACRFDVYPIATVDALLGHFRQTPLAIRFLWEPICIAALNTPIERASAQVFANVIRDALFRKRADSDLVLPRVDLSALFPEPAAHWLEQRGSRIETGARVSAIESLGTQFEVRTGDDSTQRFDTVICAVAPNQLGALASNQQQLAALFNSQAARTYEPIYTVYLRYAVRVRMSFPMLGRADGMTQWLFDREALSGEHGLVSAMISASGAHQTLDHDAIAQAAHRELGEMVGPLPAPVWHKVIAEKFATFACEPGIARPPARTEVGGFFLAGDYTEGDYPATLEGAVRSGIRAARSAHQFLSARKP
jgi:hydroxysqualene dehydroxylase